MVPPDDGLPRDATGDALRRLRHDGVDLSRPLAIDFQVESTTERVARTVQAEAERLGFSVEVYEDESGWDCCCTRSMIPDHLAITRAEDLLHDLAGRLGARHTGWGAWGGAGPPV